MCRVQLRQREQQLGVGLNNAWWGTKVVANLLIFVRHRGTVVERVDFKRKNDESGCDEWMELCN